MGVKELENKVSYLAGYHKGFKAGEDKGKQEGIKEVIEFVVANKMIPLCDYKTTGTIRQSEEHREDCRRCKWEAQLEKWGGNETKEMS